jgi:hypothetical protein
VFVNYNYRRCGKAFLSSVTILAWSQPSCGTVYSLLKNRHPLIDTKKAKEKRTLV